MIRCWSSSVRIFRRICVVHLSSPGSAARPCRIAAMVGSPRCAVLIQVNVLPGVAKIAGPSKVGSVRRSARVAGFSFEQISEMLYSGFSQPASGQDHRRTANGRQEHGTSGETADNGRTAIMRTLILQWWRGVAAASAAFLLASAVHAAEPDFVPSADLLAGRQEGGQDRPLHRQLPRHRAGRRQALCRALSRHADRDRARADRPADHAHQDRGRRQQADRRRDRYFRPGAGARR